MPKSLAPIILACCFGCSTLYSFNQTDWKITLARSARDIEKPSSSAAGTDQVDFRVVAQNFELRGTFQDQYLKLLFHSLHGPLFEPFDVQLDATKYRDGAKFLFILNDEDAEAGVAIAVLLNLCDVLSDAASQPGQAHGATARATLTEWAFKTQSFTFHVEGPHGGMFTGRMSVTDKGSEKLFGIFHGDAVSSGRPHLGRSHAVQFSSEG